MKHIYNIWTTIEKVTITDDDETYEDIENTHVKIGVTQSFEAAEAFQKSLISEDNIINS